MPGYFVPEAEPKKKNKKERKQKEEERVAIEVVGLIDA